MKLASVFHIRKAFSALAIFIIFSISAIGIVAAPATKIYVNPPINIYNPPDSFTIDINIANVFIGVSSWEFKLRWDADILYTDYSMIAEGDFLSNVGMTFFVVTLEPEPPASSSVATVGCMLMDPVTVTGSGTLATVTFLVKDTGECALQLSETQLLDSELDPIGHMTEDGEFYTTRPKASFTCAPMAPLKGETVNFDASASYDPDGTIVSYAWDFGDGSPIETEADPFITHVYTTGGAHTITLTVTDNDAFTDTDEKTVNVVIFPPEAVFIYTPTVPIVGRTTTFDASASYDPDGTIVSYAWDFGDGSPIETEADPFITHIYTTAGIYTVTLTVTDDDEATDTAQATFEARMAAIADLVKRSAWPGKRHFDQSRHGQYNILYGKVGNLGTEDVLVSVVFTIYNDVGEEIGELSAEYLLTVEEGEHNLSVDFDTYSVETGRYYVEAQCWYDSDYDDILEASGAKIKTFSFAVVL